MWTIGGADRLRFPRFPSKLEKRGNACLRPHTHRPRQQGELIIDDSKNHTRPAERTNGSTSNHLTPKAPYKPALAKTGVGELVLPATERSGPIEAWIIDDTGFPKKGRHSVGVTRQYCGQLGKQDNCQVAVSLSLANHDVSLPIAYRLYLPADWAKDQARRDKAKVPQTVAFQTKPEIAVEQIKRPARRAYPRGWC